MVIVTLVFLWLHLDGFPQRNLLLAAVVIWAIARLLRLSTFVWCNLGRGGTKASVEVLPGDAMRVTISPARSFAFKPGQYMYLYIPSVGLWTAHPFSVAWNDIALPCDRTESESIYDEKGLPAPSDPDVKGQQTLSAVIRRRTGFTNSLFQRADKAGARDGAKLTLNAYIEGPYGNERSLSSYGKVLLFAGGVGITQTMPYVKHLVEGYSANTVATRTVVLVWIIQSPEHLEWIRPWMTEILAMDKRRDILSVKLFITRPRRAKEVHSPSATVQMFPSRPNVDVLIGSECESMVGCMGVSVAGPGTLQDDVRAAVRKRSTRMNIDLMEESFSW